MSANIQEALTKSFYAWEVRGRGQLHADEAVQLEPPHRPFLLLPEHEAEINSPIDDGVVPSFWQRLFRRDPVFPKLPPEPYTEMPPFPRREPYVPVSFLLCIPDTYRTTHESMGALLRNLASTLETISFELIGEGGIVYCVVTCHELDREQVEATLCAFLPEGTVYDAGDILGDTWDSSRLQARIDFALFREFFLPLAPCRSFSVDPYIAMVAALARAREGETVCIQTLIEPTKNPWGRTIIDALTAEDGTCFFEDAPEFLRQAELKAASPFYAVSLRVGVQADEERIADLLSGFDGVFDQYSAPQGNELFPLDITYYPAGEEEPLLCARASHHTGMLLSLDELVGLVHLPDASVQGPLVREIQEALVEEDEDGLAIGTYDYGGEEIIATIPQRSRFEHTHIVGASGMGKSTLLLSMILQDAERGDGCMLIDPHGDLVDDVLLCMPEKRFGDVIVFDPSDELYSVGMNVLQANSIHEKNLLVSDLVSTIASLSTSWGDVMTTVLSEATLALLEGDQSYSLLDLRRFLSDKIFRAECLEPISDEAVQSFWKYDFPSLGTKSIGPLVSRLDACLRSRLLRNILGQRTGGIHLGNVMQEGKILLAKLPLGLMGENNARLLGSLLVTKCQQYAVARQLIPKNERKPFFLYIDECQYFVTPSLAAIYSGGRKYMLGTTLSHQYLSQLNRVPDVADAISEITHTRIVFRTGAKDARSLAQSFSTFDTDTITSLGRGEAIVRRGSAGDEVAINTIHVEVPDNPKKREALIKRSQETYGVPTKEIEAQFRSWYARSVEEPEEKLGRPIAAEPVQPKVDLPPSTTPLPDTTASLPNTTPDPVQQPTERQKPKPFPEPSELGHGGQQHTYLQHLIKRLAEERGCKAVIEAPCDGGQVDVLLSRGKTKVACEISITTDLKHEMQNVAKCRAGNFSHILCIVQKAKMRERMQKQIEKEDSSTSGSKQTPVSVITSEQVYEALESLFPAEQAAAKSVKGYKVKVRRGTATEENHQSKIAEIIAKAMKRG